MLEASAELGVEPCTLAVDHGDQRASLTTADLSDWRRQSPGVAWMPRGPEPGPELTPCSQVPFFSRSDAYPVIFLPSAGHCPFFLAVPLYPEGGQTERRRPNKDPPRPAAADAQTPSGAITAYPHPITHHSAQVRLIGRIHFLLPLVLSRMRWRPVLAQ